VSPQISSVNVPKKQQFSEQSIYHGAADSFVSLLSDRQISFSIVSPDSDFLRVNCLPHPALWARLTAEGTEYFWIETTLSAAQLNFNLAYNNLNLKSYRVQDQKNLVQFKTGLHS
jgi:hypothetical protein